jgi:hypothetical protein
MIKFYYVNGAIIEDNAAWDKAVISLQRRGLRFYQTKDNILIPMEHPTIMYIKFEEDEDGQEQEEVSTVSEPQGTGREDEGSREETETREVREEKELSPQEKKDAMLAEMRRLSSCTHEDSDDVVYYQATSVGKDKKPAKRYFHVCGNCGVRKGKYVKASSLEDNVKLNAKAWDK